ncbi:hypothetical protein HQ563_13805, partial [bacterium]|nr:hypothetical protein [bacterium]
FFHIPPYTCVDNHSDDTDVQRELVPLFEEYGVTMVFNGHSHAYERYFHNGVYYIVTGGGGAPLSNLINDNKEPIRQVGSSVRHHCVIDVATDTLTFVALDNSGNDFDSLFLEHTPPNPPENLVAVAGTEEVSLYWDENLETDIAGYNVYRSETSGSGYAKINDGLVTAIEYLDTDVVGGTTYYYVVTAMDTSGNESGASNEASAMPEADYDAYVSQDPIVTYGTVGGNGIAGTVAAGDGLVQTITEVPNGTAGMASLEVEYVLHTTANPAEVAELVLYLDANWTELDADPLLVSIYDGSGYEDITAAIQSGSFTPASQPQNYVNVDGNISVLFTDTEPIRKEKKDTLTIDLLYAHILAGPPDTEPPAPPEGLTATAGDTIVDLDWDDNTEPDRDGYYVYRSESESGTYSLITTQAVSPSFYQDTGLANGVTYYYKVSAVDFSGNPSALSEPPASATPVDLPPSAPTGLVATPGNGKVTLDWDDNPESDLDGYNVYRRTASGSYDFEAPLTTVADSADVDNSVANGTTYYYVVTAVDEAEPPNESEISNEASAIPSESQTVHVKSIAMALESAGKNWKAVATVLIHDQSSTAQSGAVVFGDWYLNGKSIQTGASGTTDGSGYAVLTSPPRKAKSGETFTFTVTDVVLTGFVYDPSDNVETTDSIPVE